MISEGVGSRVGACAAFDQVDTDIAPHKDSAGSWRARCFVAGVAGDAGAGSGDGPGLMTGQDSVPWPNGHSGLA